MDTFKLQSAMEYLMTYSWAVLVIAVVLIAFFAIGVFSPGISGPRAAPGSCQVYRPQGPGSTYLINFVGTCNDEMPRYVMSSYGTDSYVIVPGSNSAISSLNIQGNTITLSAWVYIIGTPFHDIVDKENQYGMKIDVNNQPHACTPSNNPGICLEWDTASDWYGNGFPIPGAQFNQWMFLAVTMQGNEKYWYANGAFLGNVYNPNSITYTNANYVIGAISPGFVGFGEAEWFNGWIANVQLYNTTLSSNDIKSLYMEGIGGVPISPQNLVGWWPLNGDGQDYSGNGNSDVPANVAFFTSWSNGYTIP